MALSVFIEYILAMKKLVLISGLFLMGAASCGAAGPASEQTSQASSSPAINPIEVKAMTTGQPASVVELFTSQGCSSCPPANKFAAALSQDEDKLVLSYGVTYWDYLGWKDTFGDPEFTIRQRTYGKAFKEQNIYTPQLVLNGASHSSRYSRSDVESMVLPETKAAAKIVLSEGKLVVKSKANENSKLVIVSYMPGIQSVDVKRGENRGRQLELANVVTKVMPAQWSGEVLKTEIEAKDGQAYAALFHDPQTAEITTAAVYYPKS